LGRAAWFSHPQTLAFATGEPGGVETRLADKAGSMISRATSFRMRRESRFSAILAGHGCTKNGLPRRPNT
jgi:hypothetical protein